MASMVRSLYFADTFIIHGQYSIAVACRFVCIKFLSGLFLRVIWVAVLRKGIGRVAALILLMCFDWF